MEGGGGDPRGQTEKRRGSKEERRDGEGAERETTPGTPRGRGRRAKDGMGDNPWADDVVRELQS